MSFARSTYRLSAALLVSSVSASACRYRYELLDLPANNGTGGTLGSPASASSGNNNGGTMTNAGGDNPTHVGGGNGTSGGVTGDAGAPLDSAGAPFGGGTDAMGDGGAAGDSGTAKPPQCAATADCSCASIQGHSYWFCNNVLPWAESEAHCMTQAMHLVRVDSTVENDFLVNEGTTFGVFDYSGIVRIGGTDQAVAGEWRWVDGTLFWQGGPTGSAPNGLFANWAGTSPSTSGTRQCAGLLPTSFWQDRACKFDSPFVCEGP